MTLEELQTEDGVLKWMRHGQYQKGHKQVARAIARAMQFAAAWDEAPNALSALGAMARLDPAKPTSSPFIKVTIGPPPAAKKDTP